MNYIGNIYEIGYMGSVHVVIRAGYEYAIFRDLTLPDKPSTLLL